HLLGRTNGIWLRHQRGADFQKEVARDRRCGRREPAGGKEKMKSSLLQGGTIRHPLHPLLVHFPIGLFLFSFVLDVASFAAKPASFFVRGAFYSMLFGLVMAALAAIPGIVDWTDIRADHPAKKTATTHALLNVAALVLYIANAWIRSQSLSALHIGSLPFLLSLGGVVLLSISGYLGGAMIYDEGISVGRHRRQSRTPMRTIKV